jgi:hypothetical protein
MLYYVMNGLEIVAICSRAVDAHALAGYNYTTQKTYQVVAKMVDSTA